MSYGTVPLACSWLPAVNCPTITFMWVFFIKLLQIIKSLSPLISQREMETEPQRGSDQDFKTDLGPQLLLNPIS